MVAQLPYEEKYERKAIFAILVLGRKWFCQFFLICFLGVFFCWLVVFCLFFVRVALWFGSIGLEKNLKNSPRIALTKEWYLLMFWSHLLWCYRSAGLQQAPAVFFHKCVVLHREDLMPRRALVLLLIETRCSTTDFCKVMLIYTHRASVSACDNKVAS